MVVDTRCGVVDELLWFVAVATALTAERVEDVVPGATVVALAALVALVASRWVVPGWTVVRAVVPCASSSLRCVVVARAVVC